MTVPFNLPEAEPPLTRPMRIYATRTRLLFLAFILILSAFPLRAGTKIIHRWVLSDQTLPKLQKILVIGVIENYLIRQELEDEMERLLAKSGAQGHAQRNQRSSHKSRRPPLCVPPAAYSNFWPYWNMAWGNANATSSYVKEDTYVGTEFKLYNLKDEKLLWSGETDTVYTKDFGKLAREYARALVKQLKKDNVIGTK